MVMCCELELLEVVLYALYVLECVRCALLRMLELLEVMRCVLLCMLKAVERASYQYQPDQPGLPWHMFREWRGLLSAKAPRFREGESTSASMSLYGVVAWSPAIASATVALAMLL